MSIKENFTSFWDRVTGKTLYQVSQTVSQLEERMNMLQLDLDASNIKLASTEIDLEASNIEKEIIKSELEEKKSEIARLNLTITNLKGELATATTSAVSNEQLDALTRKIAQEEYLATNYKNKFNEIVNMLTVMSKDEKYSDIIRIQTNSIDENGKETRQVYMNYNDVTVEVDETVTVEATTAADATTAFTGKESTWLNGGANDVKVVSAGEAEKAIYANMNNTNVSAVDEALDAMYANINELANIELAMAEESVEDIAEELMAN